MLGVLSPATRFLSGAVVIMALVNAPLATAAPAYAASACAATASPAPAVTDAAAVPWAVAASGVDGLNGVANGTGETVAVIDSGVNPLPSLGNRLLPGHDLLGSTDGRTDCVGHGTAVASIIAANHEPGVGFRGLAPGVKILPVRVTDAELVGSQTTGDAGTPAGLGRAINWAVDHGANVLNISVVVGVDNSTVRAAVARAVAKGVVVVASVGNNHSDSGPDPTPYPAAYPDVIGVGSIDSSGQRSQASEVGPFLDVVAPGGGVTADRLPSGLGTFDGTSFAVPYVAATVALVRQEFPNMSAAAVAHRIDDTTDPPPLGADATGYGHGIVDPYRAVAGVLPGPGASTQGAPHQPQPRAAARGAGPTADVGLVNPGRQRSVVLLTTAITLVILGFAWVFAAAFRRRADHGA